MTIRRFDLGNRGLARVLGELQAQILEVVWQLGQPTVKEVAVALGEGVHVKTVMTIMNRMVQKDLLRRHRLERHFIYEAVLPQEVFLQQVVSEVLTGLLTDFGSVSLVHLVEEATPQQLDELERLIADRHTQGMNHDPWLSV